MARLGGMSSDTFSSPSAGLGSILRDQKVIPGVRSSRANVILGIARPPATQSVSVSSSPVESFLLDVDTGADDADELKEEDIWGMEDTTEGTGPGSDFGKHIMSTADDFTPKQRANWAMEELGLAIGSPREVLVSSRRREKGFGAADAFVNGGSMGLSPLSRASESSASSSRSRIPRRPSASRMIPLSGGSGKDSSRRHAEGQSAPVEVPKWSKLMGRNSKKMGIMDEDDGDDKDEDDERLPPHELLARENDRSQRTTFSVCEGLGRTLKGRDMSRVRNAVWSKMGFAD